MLSRNTLPLHTRRQKYSEVNSLLDWTCSRGILSPALLDLSSSSVALPGPSDLEGTAVVSRPVSDSQSRKSSHLRAFWVPQLFCSSRYACIQ